MNLSWSPDDLAFRDQVRAFLDAELTPNLRDATSRMTSVYAPPAIALEWQRRLFKHGWVAPAWPTEYGGCGWSAVRKYIFARECAVAGAPPLSPMGLCMCGPVMIGYGSPAQKAHWLPRMLAGEDFWCQGYSETESGSDLASLSMKAERDGDVFVCNGQKIWTTHANAANMMFCLVRTTRLERPQQGITFLLIDMTDPGVTVRPIISLSGEHIQNLVQFDNVRVPVDNVVGAIDDGWRVAKYLMEFERGSSLYAPELAIRLNRVQQCLGTDANPRLMQRLALLRIEVDALDALELQFMSRLSLDAAPGSMASMLKILGTEVSQRISAFELDAAGPYAAAWQPQLTVPGGATPGYDGPLDGSGAGPAHAAKAAAKYFNDRAGSIYAGTNEIQRNIMWGAVSLNSVRL